jgi:hypothetical protein
VYAIDHFTIGDKSSWMCLSRVKLHASTSRETITRWRISRSGHGECSGGEGGGEERGGWSMRSTVLRLKRRGSWMCFDKNLATREYIAGDDCSLAHIAIWPW